MVKKVRKGSEKMQEGLAKKSPKGSKKCRKLFAPCVVSHVGKTYNFHVALLAIFPQEDDRKVTKRIQKVMERNFIFASKD